MRVNLLLHLLLLGASIHLLPRLQLQGGASLAPAVGIQRIHGTLERVSLPPKEVIAVCAVAGSVQTQISTTHNRVLGR